MEDIPLNEAVARGIIPCSVCGAAGADVRKIGDRNHFLCARCLRKGRTWTVALTALAVFAVGLGGFLVLRHRAPGVAGPDAPPDSKAPPEHVTKEIVALLDTKQYGPARARIQELLSPFPKRPDLNLLLGKCLMGLKAWDAAVAPLQIAFDAGPPTDDLAALFLGLALKSMGRSAEALKFLELPTALNKEMPLARAEAYLDLERYGDALQLLPDTADTLWARHRAVLYLGKADDARKLVEGRDPFLLAGQLREEGDFAGAAKILDANPGPRATKAALILAIESGDLAKVDVDLPSDDAPYFRAIGHLLNGRREKAQAAAWEFLAKCDKENGPLRLERMAMRHLAGELKDADLDAEAKRLNRFLANDVYWYLALATGEKSWAEKAAAETPGHNYPYHAIQRLLKK